MPGWFITNLGALYGNKPTSSFPSGSYALILGFIAVVVGLGTMLGKMLAESGGAEVVARTFIRAFGPSRLHGEERSVAPRVHSTKDGSFL